MSHDGRPVVYLIGTSGHPNYGDELIAAGWLRFLARTAPRRRSVARLTTPRPKRGLARRTPPQPAVRRHAVPRVLERTDRLRCGNVGVRPSA